MKKLMESKIMKVSVAIIKAVLTILIIGFVAVVYLQRASDNKISLFNFRMFTVVSGSMAPEYNVGDVLLAKEVKASKIKVGDNITYLGDKGDFKGKIVTHQVIKIELKDGKHQFYTKGIANLVEDPIVNENQIYGKIMHRLISLSIINKIIRTNIGFYLCIIVPVMFIIGSEIVTVQLRKEEKRRLK